MRKQKNQTTLHKKNKIKIKIAVTMVEDDNKNLEKTLNLKSTQMKGRKGHVKKKEKMSHKKNACTRPLFQMKIVGRPSKSS